MSVHEAITIVPEPCVVWKRRNHFENPQHTISGNGSGFFLHYLIFFNFFRIFRREIAGGSFAAKTRKWKSK
jgi:hypothetical protein